MGFLDKAMGSVASATGRVGPDLTAWATERGLTYAGETPVTGIAFELRKDRRSNTCFGKLPGGEMGVVAHEYSASTGSRQTGGSRTETQTRAAVRVPEAVAPLRRFLITNSSELTPHRIGANDQQIDTVAHGLGQSPSALESAAGILGRGSGVRWTMVAANPIDPDIIRGLLGGEVGDALEAYPGPFELRYAYGTLTLMRDRGYLEGAELDAHCELLCSVAQQMRKASLARAKPEPFDAELAEPAWLSEPPPEGPTVKKLGGISMMTGTAALPSPESAGFDAPLPAPMQEGLKALAQGAALEDSIAYHGAFPSNPAPGRAFAVMRRDHQGATARIALHTEGDFDTGPCVALIGVSDSAPNHPAPITTEVGAMSVGVSDAIMAAWMYRDGSFGAEQFTAIADQAVAVANQQGWLPA